MINFATYVSSQESFWAQHNLKNKGLDTKGLRMH